MDQLFQILYDRPILRYADPINSQYIFWLKNNLKLPTIANLADTKKEIKLADIKLWYLYIGHLSYKNLRTLKDLSSEIDFKKTALKQLYKDYQKSNQTCQPSKTPIS